MSFDEWLVYLHVLAVLLFFLGHGGSAASVVRLRRERDPAKVKAILDLSMTGNLVANISLVALLVFGVWVGITKGWWTNGQLWLWTSVVLLVLVIVAMTVFVSRHYYGVRDRWKDGRVPKSEELSAALDTSQPLVGAAVGLAGMIVILWLMMAKPF